MVDQKNLILAVALSIAILLGWQVFVEGPRIAEERARQAALEAEQAEEDALAGLDPNAGSGTAIEGDLGDMGRADTTVSRADALTLDARVVIDTPRLHGSIALTGARLDDLTLADYHVTVDPESAEIELLSPPSAPNPYFADFGWLAAEDIATPDAESLWTANASRLTPDAPVTLSWDNGAGLVFEKTIAVDEDYLFTVTQRVRNAGEQTVELSPWGRIRRVGTPDTLGFFILHEGPYGVFNGTLSELSYNGLQDEGTIQEDTVGGWLGFTDKYWLVGLIPDQDEPIQTQFVHRGDGGDRYFATYQAQTRVIPPGDSVEVTNRMFAGAKEVSVIDAYQEQFGIEKFDRAIDFGWFYFMTKPFFYALQFLNNIFGNFGVAILVFTVGIKLLFFPLANKSYKSMSRMKALQPKMQELRELYSDDRQKMQMELMELYKREKVNPAAGCLPILIQIPVFFALYKVLFVTIEMRHAPFFGWIEDLSAPDPTSVFNLFGLIPYEPAAVPIIGGLLAVGVWPLLMGISMYLQQKLNPAPPDPLQAKIFLALPIVFTFFLASFPAGLVIYWTWNNMLSILQQWVIMRRMGIHVDGTQDAQPAHAPPSVERKKTRTEGGGLMDRLSRMAQDARAQAEARQQGKAGKSGGSKAAKPTAAKGKTGTSVSPVDDDDTVDVGEIAPADAEAPAAAEPDALRRSEPTTPTSLRKKPANTNRSGGKKRARKR